MALTETRRGKRKRNRTVSRSSRAGLQFPVGRFHRLLKTQSNARVGIPAAVYLTAVMEYLTAEVLESAGNACRALNKKRITPRHVLLGIKGDEDMDNLINATIAEGGVAPYIQKSLLKTLKRKKE